MLGPSVYLKGLLIMEIFEQQAAALASLSGVIGAGELPAGVYHDHPLVLVFFYETRQEQLDACEILTEAGWSVVEGPDGAFVASFRTGPARYFAAAEVRFCLNEQVDLPAPVPAVDDDAA